MRFRSIAIVCWAALLGPVLLTAQQPTQNPPAQAPTQPAPSPAEEQKPIQSGSTIKTTVNLVDVLFTVLNRRNKLVSDLDKQDFKIYDDNVQQDIRYFSKQTDLPLRIGMLLDTSNSIRDG